MTQPITHVQPVRRSANDIANAAGANAVVRGMRSQGQSANTRASVGPGADAVRGVRRAPGAHIQAAAQPAGRNAARGGLVHAGQGAAPDAGRANHAQPAAGPGAGAAVAQAPTVDALAVMQMPRPIVLCTLLALGPLTEPELRDITGWPRTDLHTALAAAVASGGITYRNTGRGMREYTATRKHAAPAKVEA